MKTVYIDIIDKAVSAYSIDRIMSYYHDVQQKGIREHGFSRLTANIGILISHGRRLNLRDLFIKMMDTCCEQVPYAKEKNEGAASSVHMRVGNDFAVRELVTCILEIESAKALPKEITERWRSMLAVIDPYNTYSEIAPVPAKRIGNWAMFAAASEQIRIYAKIGKNENKFIDDQIASQVLSLEENGFYRDPNEPMLYDVMTRLLMVFTLKYGYNGIYAAEMRNALQRSMWPTILMQSVTGEIPYGGRSNQFLFNEACLAAICEGYASICKLSGKDQQASIFKRSAELAVQSINMWMNRQIIHHVKNNYPQDSYFGCESYAYFDKYMVTLGSNIFLAYLLADDDIMPAHQCPAESGGYIYQTGDYFHKVFLNSGIYSTELEVKADYHYDSSGIGRIHRKDAPSCLAISVPFTIKEKDGKAYQSYKTDIENPFPVSVCGGLIGKNKTWEYTSQEEAVYKPIAIMHSCPVIVGYPSDDQIAAMISQDEIPVENSKGQLQYEYICNMNDGQSLQHKLKVTEDGVSLQVKATGKVRILIPAFSYDGEIAPELSEDPQELMIYYKGWMCQIKTNGTFVDLNTTIANRNGHYRMFAAQAENKVSASWTICQQTSGM